MADTTDDLLKLCQDTIDKYSERDTGLDSLEDYYFLESDSEDKRDDDDQEGIERVRLPHGTNTVDLAQDLLAGAELTITVPARSELKKDKGLADDEEEYLQAAMHQSERVQRQNMLGRMAWLVSMRASLAGRVLPVTKWIEKGKGNGDEERTVGDRLPLLIQLRDPRNVYVEWGIDGMAFVVERWERSAQDVRHTYGEDMLPGKQPSDEVEWTEHWNDTHRAYWADGESVEVGQGKGQQPHGCGGNPYSFEFARQTGLLAPEKRARPLLEGQRNTIDRLDLTDSMEATGVSQNIGTAYVVETEEPDDFELDLSHGAVNYLRMGEKVLPIQAGRVTPDLEKMRAKYQIAFERGTFPGTLYGEDPGRLVAGYAINLLNQSGQMRLAPMIECMERFLESMLSNVLMVTEHHLAPLVDGPIPFYVYGEKEGDEGGKYRARDERTLDAEAMDGYYHVEVSLGETMPADEAANIQLALQARTPDATGRPLLSWETALEKFKLSGSATEERHRIDRELAMENPEIKALREKLVVAEVRQELEDELAKLPEEYTQPPPQPEPMMQPDVMPEDVMPQPMIPQPVPQEVMPPGLPPELAGIPPEVLAQMLAQIQAQGPPPEVAGMMPGDETMPMV